MDIGFIGLGSLGSRIAMNLLERHPGLYVFNRTPEKMKPLVEKGAVACDSVAQLASACDVIFSIVSDDVAINEVCNGNNGLIANMKKGGIHVSMSTILPGTAEALAGVHASNGLQYVAAPVFGRPDAAMNRALQFVITGEQSACKQIEPLLNDAGAAGIRNFGTVVMAANVVKLCGNFMIAAAMEAIGESTTLAQKSGVDPRLMWEMFTQTLFNTPIYKNYSNLIINDTFKPAAFTAKLGLKDIRLVEQQSKSVQHNMPLAELLRDHYDQLVEHGEAEIDWSAVYKGGLFKP